MWSLPEILVQNNPELRSPETEETKLIKADNRRVALAKSHSEDIRFLDDEGIPHGRFVVTI